MAESEASDALRLDPFERRILIELQANARLTNEELAKRVGLSPSACWRRDEWRRPVSRRILSPRRRPPRAA